MIAAWMFYCALCALGLAAAAALAEQVLLRSRAPTRVVWFAAVTLSVLVPAIAFRFSPRPVVTIVENAVDRATQLDPATRVAHAASAATVKRVQTGRQTVDVRAFLASLDAWLAVAWAASSLGVGLFFFSGIIALRWMRQSWREDTALGVAVFVSERTGPAVVGVLSPSIVLPEWALALEPCQLALMLRHEEEHRRAGDAQLLTVAQLALVAMPWNAALWWQILRLRVAVEMDCDSRVLRDTDVRAYGDLLLEVARPRLGPTFIGTPAFAERATQLEKRIRVLKRHRSRPSRMARVAVTGVGLLAVTVAWISPHPSVPARTVLQSASASPPSPVVAPPAQEPAAPTGTKDAATPTEKRVTDKSLPAALNPIVPTTPVSEKTFSAVCGRDANGQEVPPLVDSVYQRLFDAIALTATQRAAACDLFTTLYQQQQLEDASLNVRLMASAADRLRARLERDSTLRALLTNDADRATLEARMALPGGRGGGRRGAPPPAPTTSGRGGRGGGPGRGGAENDSVAAVANVQAADAAFHRLFDGIPLTADQEARARTAIINAQRLSLNVLPPPPRIHLRLNAITGLVTMPAPSDSVLLAIVSDDADKAKLRSRINVFRSVP